MPDEGALLKTNRFGGAIEFSSMSYFWPLTAGSLAVFPDRLEVTAFFRKPRTIRRPAKIQRTPAYFSLSFAGRIRIEAQGRAIYFHPYRGHAAWRALEEAGWL